MASYLANKIKQIGGAAEGGGAGVVDISYVTPRVIATSQPGTKNKRSTFGFNLQSHSVSELAAVLNKKHGGCYMVWNLSQNAYDYEKFEGATVLDNYGWEDGLAPPLQTLFSICQSMETWLQAGESNVCVVHCSTGKGRTGTAIASFLLYSQYRSSTLEALRHFAVHRSGTGVLRPSQRRYVNYVKDMLAGTANPISPALIIRRLVITPVPECEPDGSATIAIEILQGERRACVFSSLPESAQAVVGTTLGTRRASSSKDILDVPSHARLGVGLKRPSTPRTTRNFEGCVVHDFGSLAVSDDIVINIYHLSRTRPLLIGRACLNVAFAPTNGVLKIDKPNIDIACENTKVFGPNSSLQIAFSNANSPQEKQLVIDLAGNGRKRGRWKNILNSLHNHLYSDTKLSGYQQYDEKAGGDAH
jgi:hypothetical protein